MAKEKSDDGKCEQERKPTDPDNDETIAYEQAGDHSNQSNKENDELEHEKSRTSKKIVDNSKTGTHLKTTTKNKRFARNAQTLKINTNLNVTNADSIHVSYVQTFQLIC